MLHQPRAHVLTFLLTLVLVLGLFVDDYSVSSGPCFIVERSEYVSENIDASRFRETFARGDEIFIKVVNLNVFLEIINNFKWQIVDSKPYVLMGDKTAAHSDEKPIASDQIVTLAGGQ